MPEQTVTVELTPDELALVKLAVVRTKIYWQSAAQSNGGEYRTMRAQQYRDLTEKLFNVEG